jgi:hypothetical protein
LYHTASDGLISPIPVPSREVRATLDKPMPIDLNVLNYFLIILGGFGVVWSFRLVNGRKPIAEFEYAAFSTLWGIPLFFLFVYGLKGHIDQINMAFAVPMTATPTLFIMGIILGGISGFIWKYFRKTISSF